MANKPESRLTDQQRFDWLRLTRSENVGPRRFRALTTNSGCVRAALNALPELARRGGAKLSIVVASVEEVEKELIAASKLGVRFVALGEPDYPSALREIDSAPLFSLFGGARRRCAKRRSRSWAPATLPLRDSRSPSGWRAVWDKPATSSSPGWRGGSTSAPMVRAWRSAPSECSLGDMESPILARLCRSWSGWSKRARSCPRCRSNGSRAGEIFRAAIASSRDSHWVSWWSRRRGVRARSLRHGSRSNKTVRSSPCPALPSIPAPTEPTIS